MENINKPSATTTVTEPQNESLYPNKAGFKPEKSVTIGGVILCNRDIEYNASRPTNKITIRNRGDRPIQVGSHFHLFEVNRYLEFDRAAAFGCHLNIPATTAIRFEPGDSKEVEIVTYGGKQRVVGFNSLVDGYTGTEDEPSYYPVRCRAMRLIKRRGFCTTDNMCKGDKENQCKKTNDKQ
jgi:urease subunit beta